MNHAESDNIRILGASENINICQHMSKYYKYVILPLVFKRHFLWLQHHSSMKMLCTQLQ